MLEGEVVQPDPNLVEQAAKCIGYEHLEVQQVEAIVQVLSGKDTFVALPTGFGKSVIYAVLPLAFDMLKGKTPYHC